MTICDLPTYECHSTMPYFFVMDSDAGYTPSGVACFRGASAPPTAELQPPLATIIAMQSPTPEIVALVRFMSVASAAIVPAR